MLAVLGGIGMFVVVGEVIMPIVSLGKSIYCWQAVILLSMPLYLTVVLGFFTIWECLFNCYAEITKFADREFYQDWWNCIKYDEFMRKWNTAVHQFLFRHVYLEFRVRFNMSKQLATLLTVVCSGVMHQLVGSVIFRKWDLFYITMMMAQFPTTIAVERLAKSQSFGSLNLNFWLGAHYGNAMILVNFMSDRFA